MSWRDPYDYVYVRLWLRILLGLVVLVITIFGTVLVCGLISFERFTGDPRKRGVLNQVIHFSFNLVFLNIIFLKQLVAQMLSTDLALQWLAAPILFWRLAIGPLSIPFFAWSMIFAARIYFFLVVFIGTEYLTIKYMSVIVLKRVLPIIDDFFGLYFFIANLTAIIWISYIASHSEWSARTALRYAGKPDISNSALGI